MEQLSCMLLVPSMLLRRTSSELPWTRFWLFERSLRLPVVLTQPHAFCSLPYQSSWRCRQPSPALPVPCLSNRLLSSRNLLSYKRTYIVCLLLLGQHFMAVGRFRYLTGCWTCRVLLWSFALRVWPLPWLCSLRRLRSRANRWRRFAVLLLVRVDTEITSSGC